MHRRLARTGAVAEIFNWTLTNFANILVVRFQFHSFKGLIVRIHFDIGDGNPISKSTLTGPCDKNDQLRALN